MRVCHGRLMVCAVFIAMILPGMDEGSCKGVELQMSHFMSTKHPQHEVNVFVIKGVAEDVPLGAIFKGICPFLVANLIAIAVIVVFPEVALYIPSKMRWRA